MLQEISGHQLFQTWSQQASSLLGSASPWPYLKMEESTVLRISSVYLKRVYWNGLALPSPTGSATKQHQGC